MAKLLIVPTILLLLYASSAFSATVYTVSDNAGWDISTDLDTWAKDKIFAVGDTLLFQYSQYHSVSEVTQENYEGCNTSNVLQSSSNGNTSFALTSPGDRYFVCGNRLHCLGGMKLHAHVAGNGGVSSSPVGSPQAQAQPADGGSDLPTGSSSRRNSPASSAASSTLAHVRAVDTLVLAFLGLFVVLFGFI